MTCGHPGQSPFASRYKGLYAGEHMWKCVCHCWLYSLNTPWLAHIFDQFYTFVEHWLNRRYFVKICWSEMIRTCQKPWLFVQHTRFWWRRNRCSVDWQVLFVSCLISVLTSWPDWIRVFLACCSVDFLWKNSRFSPLLCQVRWPNEKARGGLGSPIQKWDCPEMQLKYNPTSLS